MQHVRIDDGVPRGPRVRPKIKKRLPNGTIAPIDPLIRAAAVQDALTALVTGDTTDQIAQRHGIIGRTLRSWLISEPGADQARAAMISGHLSEALSEIDAAQDPLPLARAREKFRSWAWIAERRLPALFGPTHDVSIHHTIDLGDRLRRAQERIIEGVTAQKIGNSE